MSATYSQFLRRKNRVRRSLKKSANGKPRLCVFRSSKHIYVQIIDDIKGVTLASASSVDKEVRSNLSKGSDKKAAEEIGRVIGERASKAGITDVVFDRGGYLYHGRVKALAEAARANGLKF